MAVTAGGDQAGTIGGGRIEHEAVAIAREVAAGAPPRLTTFHLTRDLAMCCGGTMEVYVEPGDGAATALRAAVDAAAARTPICIITSLASGQKRPEAMPAGEGKPVRRGDVFVEPVVPSARALLFGAGHVGRATGKLLRDLGFEVIVCDDNDTGAINTGPPWAHRVIASFAIADVVAAIGPLGIGDYAIVATRDHAVDQQILEELFAAGYPLTYLGLIGSRAKIARFSRRLEAKNLATPETWAKVAAPIGLDIGADTPEEIAVAIAGQIVAVRAGRGVTMKEPQWSRR